MCFRKSKVEKAFQSFQFLIDYGFSLKRYLRPPDDERVYTKGNITVEVLYTLCVFQDYTHGMSVDVILTVDGDRNNLLKCNKLFDNNLLDMLKNNIEAVTPLERIAIYADFIKTNIDTLLQSAK